MGIRVFVKEGSSEVVDFDDGHWRGCVYGSIRGRVVVT